MRKIGIAAKPGTIEDRVVPMITRTKRAVNTISAMITAPSSNPPGECDP
jgi:hypothetical protein